MKYLNLGCGLRFHPDWVNIDIGIINPAVLNYDLRNGIPFPDLTFDLVYHSHVLEHFTRDLACDFIKECYRVLKPGGIIRIVVPDLETIVRLYLKSLEKLLNNEPGWKNNYEWIMLELFDQTVREYSGGKMLQYLKQDPIPNKDFIQDRIGGELQSILNDLKTNSIDKQRNCKLLIKSNQFFHHLPALCRKIFLRILLCEKDFNALQVGKFRSQGEIHQWMYDRYSLTSLLNKTGFQDPIVRNAYDSAFENWQLFYLDANSDGSVYKPDSLYMEAIKPDL